ncbi:uncharacterized protein DS421_14g457750 [Arachis hypogaea]|nr:uncharacterized protein DS421_14g457750 [Arachis hypogaea]
MNAYIHNSVLGISMILVPYVEAENFFRPSPFFCSKMVPKVSVFFKMVLRTKMPLSLLPQNHATTTTTRTNQNHHPPPTVTPSPSPSHQRKLRKSTSSSSSSSEFKLISRFKLRQTKTQPKKSS